MTGRSTQGAAGTIVPEGSGGAARPEPIGRSGTLQGAAGDPIVLMRGVTKRFGEFTAVSDLDLMVPRGGLVAMIGPSGCGKTTTLRLLLGVYEPTEGECLVFGQPSHHIRRPVRERIGYLPQQFVLYPTLTVEENLGFAAAIYGLGAVRRRRNEQAILELVGLGEARKKLARDISGGMQRRLALAATLIHQPDLLFLDEPTAGIDPILREQLWTEFRRLQEDGRTQFVTTQYIAEAEYCDKVILMDHGRIVAYGAPEELRRSTAGGDLIDLTSADLDRAMRDRLRRLPGVSALRMIHEDQIRLTVEDAAESMPRVMEAVQEGGGAVQAIEERRLSFSEVFVAILQEHGRTDAGVGRYDE